MQPTRRMACIIYWLSLLEELPCRCTGIVPRKGQLCCMHGWRMKLVTPVTWPPCFVSVDDDNTFVEGHTTDKRRLWKLEASHTTARFTHLDCSVTWMWLVGALHTFEAKMPNPSPRARSIMVLARELSSISSVNPPLLRRREKNDSDR